MSMGLLGTTIDLHGGGSDLIFPHHECERAQSEAATGTTFVRHWMHCGMVACGGTKMSKSLRNLVFIGELAKIASYMLRGSYLRYNVGHAFPVFEFAPACGVCEAMRVWAVGVGLGTDSRGAAAE